MENELQATRIGESKSSELLKPEVKRVISGDTLNLSLRGTMIGEESEFEKSLKGSMPEEAVVEVVAPATTIEENVVASVSDEAPAIETIEKIITPAPAAKLKIEVMPEPAHEPEAVHETTKEVHKDSHPKEDTEVYGMSLKNYSEGDIIKGTVLAIEKAGIFVDIGYKCEGFVSNEELGGTKTGIKIGDCLMLFLIQLETKEGYTLLSKKRADWELSWKEAYQSYKLKEVVEVNVENTVKGGLVVNYKGLRGFIPSSLVSRSKADQLQSLVGQNIPACFVEVDKKRKKIIFSNKTPDRQMDNSKSDIFDALEAGQVIQGRVTSIKDFGAFVNINGIEGLIHISELSWDRIDKVEDVLKVGDQIDVFILGVDKESKKVSLGLKQLTPDPWEKVEEVYPVGSIVNGTVSRLTTFGAFLKLEHGLEGLVHISELSHKHIKHVEDVVKVGDHLQVKVLRVIPEEQKIGLSLKQLQDEEPIVEESAEEDIPTDVEADE